MTDHADARNAPTASLLQRYAGAIALVAASTLVGLWVAPRWGTAPVDMIYLPAVLAAAVMWGLGPALVAGIGAALAYNFFFTAPVHTLRIDRVTDFVTVVVLLIVGLVTSRLASGVRRQAWIASVHAARNATIAGFARRLLSCRTETEIGTAACAELRRLFDCNAMLVSGLPEPGVIATAPEGNRLTPSDIAAAALAIESGEPAGRATSQLQPAEWQFYPLVSDRAGPFAVGLARDDGMSPLNDKQAPLLANLLDQLVLALERAQLESEAREFAALRQRDGLRAALLSSIGQDLRPRLTTVSNAVDDLRRGTADDKSLLNLMASEITKLDRYITNLLDLDTQSDRHPIEAAGVTIDLFNRSVTKDGEAVHLTPKEFAVLAELAKHGGRVLSHAHLLRTVWGPAQEEQIDYLRVAIRALRQKLEVSPSKPMLIINEPAVGYRLAANCLPLNNARG